MPELASVNGVVTPLAEAVVPILDRGFLYGDAAYEVVRVYGGRPFRLRAHLERLRNTCAGLRFARVPATADLEAACLDVVRQSGIAEAALSVNVTRGLERPGASLAQHAAPSVVVRVTAPPAWPSAWYERGMKLITVPEQRWAHNEFKTVNLIPRILAFDDASAAGAGEALWVAEDGTVFEGLSCNVFAFVERPGGPALVTPPLGSHVLAGVTRSALLELGRAAGHDVREERLTRADLRAAPEVFIASTTRELVPVAQVDDDEVGGGRPGPRTRDLHQRYRALVRGQTLPLDTCGQVSSGRV